MARREIPTPPPPRSTNPRASSNGSAGVWAQIARNLSQSGQARRAKSPPAEAIRQRLMRGRR